MGASKTLVVFYSRSGTTRRIAEALSETLKCDLEEITEPKPRTGFLGYIRSILEARRKRPSIIAPKKTRRLVVRSGRHRHSGLGLVAKLPGSRVPNGGCEPTARGRILLYPWSQGQ
jgi:protein involved in ribonucleotide reduction